MPSPVQSSDPAAVSFFFFFFSLFLSVAKPRAPRQFFPPVGIRRSLHVFHVALSVCRACLGASPPVLPLPFIRFLDFLRCAPASFFFLRFLQYFGSCCVLPPLDFSFCALLLRLR